MKNQHWQESLDFDELDEQSHYEKKRNSRPQKRKWREIEMFKEQQRINKEMDLYNSYSY